MSANNKIIQIVPYNPEWSKIFEIEAAKIKEILEDDCIRLHHAGSTAVKGLYGKENIDILCVIRKLSAALKLQDIGYVFKGKLNIPLRYFFSKNNSFSKVNLHVTELAHGSISQKLSFRDYLRKNQIARDTYSRLKLELLHNPNSSNKVRGVFTGYTLGKDKFIQDILIKAGFNDLVVNFCLHDREWEAAKYFRQKYFFGPNNTEAPYTWTFNHPEHVHLVLYYGTDIIGYSHIQLWSDERAAIRIIAIDESKRNNNFGSKFLEFCEEWLKSKDYKTLHVESSPAALEFIEKMVIRKCRLMILTDMKAHRMIQLWEKCYEDRN